jgi:hypothetical protein
MKSTTQMVKLYVVEKRLKERINSFVNVPRRHNKEMSEKLWTNNNAESINHVFKIAVNWKPQSTPELINKLYDCVDIQFHHLRGALHFSRDYMPISLLYSERRMFHLSK